MSEPRIRPVLTAPERAPQGTAGGAATALLRPVMEHACPDELSIEDDAHTGDSPASRLGVARGIIIGLAISAFMWAGIVALVVFVWS